MALEYSFRCPLIYGLHARPATALAEFVQQYASRVTLTNERTGVTADAASVLELVGAGVLHDDPCRLAASGADEAAAHQALSRFIAERLAAQDLPLPKPELRGAGTVPRVLAGEQVACIAGIAASAGIGIGRAVVVGGLALPEELRAEAPADAEAELQKLLAALDGVCAALQAQLARSVNQTEADIIRASLAIVKDTAFARQLQDLINTGRRTAAQAVVEAVQLFAARIEATGSAYLRERVVDLQDIGAQLSERLGYRSTAPEALQLSEPSVVCAAGLAPRQFLALDRRFLQGLVLAGAGTTSHAVILARSFGIPAVVGVQDALAPLAGQEAVVDGNRGVVLHPVSPAVRRFYEREMERDRRKKRRDAAGVDRLTTTRDGRRIEVSANIATDAEAASALANGAEGIGLFRTEMLLAERDAPPSEDEQFGVYRRAVEAMQGRTVIIRTFDIGGDKPLPFLSLPREENPFLGNRGLRLYAEHGELIDAQLRAIARASAFGPVWVMAPMVSTVDEARWFKARVAQVQGELAGAGLGFDTEMRVGIMVEVPSATLIIDQFSAVVDFFSIGTNDLCQYFLAVDRGNRQVAALHNVRDPAFLRLLRIAVDDAHLSGKWIGMCGEMARDVRNAPLLVGLGLDELSLSAPGIPAVKAAVAKLDSAECRSILEQAMACDSAASVDALLGKLPGKWGSMPLVTEEMIVLDSDSRTKEEVIKELADLLYVAGRTDVPEQFEEALWAREAVYSTGLGHGFAIPHCKSDSVGADSLAMLKLAQPVEWGSLDGKPVGFAILLAIRESDPSDTHMRVLAKLARKLMDEGFREALGSAGDAGAMLALLAGELEINQDEV